MKQEAPGTHVSQCVCDFMACVSHLRPSNEKSLFHSQAEIHYLVFPCDGGLWFPAEVFVTPTGDVHSVISVRIITLVLFCAD